MSLLEKAPRRKYSWLRANGLILTGIVITLLLSLVVVYIYKQQQSENKLQKDFSVAIEREDYPKALKIYQEVQAQVKQANSSDSFYSMQQNLEQQVKLRVDKITHSLAQGEKLRLEDAKYISELGNLSLTACSQNIAEMTQQWLKQKESYEHWSKLIYSLADIVQLQPLTQNLLREEKHLLKAQVLFAEPLSLEQYADTEWDRIIELWQNLRDNTEIGSYAQQIATDFLQKFKQEQYPKLLNQTEQLSHEGKVYKANSILEKMLQYWPDDKQIVAQISTISQKVVGKTFEWQGPVEFASVSVLRNNSDEKIKNNQELLTPAQFKKLLQALYSHNYILMNADSVLAYGEHKDSLLVPEGKTPLVLIIDGVALSRTQIASGSFYTMEYDADKDSFYGTIGRNKRNPTKIYGEDVFSILDEFVAQHPDFSFDGAKACISLSGKEGILGHSLKKNKQALTNVLKALQSRQYTFACNTYDRLDLAKSTPTEIKKDLQKWQEEIGAMVGRTNVLFYPFGSHALNQPENLQQITDAGYRLLIGIGPQVFNMQLKQGMHADSINLSQSNLEGNYINLQNIDDLSQMFAE